MLVNLLIELGRYEEALPHAERFRDLVESDTSRSPHARIEPYFYLGRCLLATGKSSQAATYFERALEIRRQRSPDGREDRMAGELEDWLKKATRGDK
jgi:tetratricopeptide (TPR) repeat protein